uniref:Fatty-acid and retinol-binding protein 1 n=1 Tax=Bursaphelenchus xylophilus TaxID=6326 RepID=A0A1I7ST76_BURXY
MLVRVILLSLLVLFYNQAYAFFDYGEVDNQVSEIVPKEVKTFYDGLTTEDRAVLKKVLSKGSTYNNVSEVLNDLKNGSSSLYDKAVALVTDFRSTMSKLGSNSTKFIDETVLQIQRALGETFSIQKVKAEANVAVARYQALDDATKNELKEAFPVVATIINNIGGRIVGNHSQLK